MKKEKVKTKASRKVKDLEAYFFYRGFFRYHRNDFAGAVADFTAAISEKSDFAQAYCGRGLALENLNPAQAVKDFSRAIRLDPTYTEAYYRRALTHAVVFRDPLTALQDFDAALSIDEGHINSRYGRGMVLSFLREFDRADVDFTYVLRLQPDHEGCAHARAELLAKREATQQVQTMDITKDQFADS